jgi:hypothetical protein
MSEKKLKEYLALTIFLLNASILSFQALLMRFGGFDFDQFTTVVGITLPMFSCHAVAATNYLASERITKKDDSQTIRPSFIFVSFAVPSALAISIILIMLTQALGGGPFNNFEDFKKALLLLESAFSAFIGKTIYTLFTPLEDSKQSI